MSGEGNIAWLLTVAASRQIAVAECELLEYALSSELHNVPAAAPHCSNILLWQSNPVPVMQLSMLVGDTAPESSITGVCVVAYQVDDDSPLSYVGVPVIGSPVKIDIDEDQGCGPSENPDPLWMMPGISLAFFSHDDTTVPIVNIKELCANKNRVPFVRLYEPDNEAGVPKCA